MSFADLSSIDIGIIALLAISALIGFFRGFTKELFSLISWFGSVILTILLFDFGKDIVKTFIENEMVANIVTGTALFIAFLTLFSFLNHICSGFVKKSFLKPLDSGAGVVFGIIRGAAVISALFIIAEQYLWTESRPEYVSKSALLPHVEKTTNMIIIALPESWQTYVTKNLNFQAKENLKNFIDETILPEIKNTTTQSDAKQTPSSNVFTQDFEENVDREEQAEELATLKPKSSENSKERDYSQKERFDLDRMLDENILAE